MNAYIPTYISTATTTTIGTGPQILGSIIVGETAAGAITILDGADIIGVLKASIVEGEYKFNVVVKKGLSIITAGASKITVTTKPSSA